MNLRRTPDVFFKSYSAEGWIILHSIVAERRKESKNQPTSRDTYMTRRMKTTELESKQTRRPPLFFLTHNKMVFHFMSFSGAVHPQGPRSCCMCLAEGQAWHPRAKWPWHHLLSVVTGELKPLVKKGKPDLTSKWQVNSTTWWGWFKVNCLSSADQAGFY